MTEISRDKQEPTWAMVWDDGGITKYKRIIVDIFAGGECVCVGVAFNEKYMTNEFYETVIFQHYEIIKPKSWRAFKDMEEFKKEFIKRDVRIVNKTTGEIMSIIHVDDKYLKTFVRTYDKEYIFDHYTWLDGSPIGVEE